MSRKAASGAPPGHTTRRVASQNPLCSILLTHWSTRAWQREFLLHQKRYGRHVRS